MASRWCTHTHTRAHTFMDKSDFKKLACAWFKKSKAKSEAPVSPYSYMRLKSVNSNEGQGPSYLESNNVRSLSEGSVYHISMISTYDLFNYSYACIIIHEHVSYKLNFDVQKFEHN